MDEKPDAQKIIEALIARAEEEARVWRRPHPSMFDAYRSEIRALVGERELQRDCRGNELTQQSARGEN